MFIGFCLFWKNNYILIATDLIKQKALDFDSRTIGQIFLLVLQKTSKETTLQFSNGTTKVL